MAADFGMYNKSILANQQWLSILLIAIYGGMLLLFKHTLQFLRGVFIFSLN